MTFNADHPTISPSLLSCDFARLGEEAREIISFGADWLHVDVMDGHFVPNLTIGPPVIKALRNAVGPDAFLDCHFMVSEPGKWVEPSAKGGASLFTFHIEATEHPLELIQRIHGLGMKAGVSIKPATPVSALSEEVLAAVDMVLIMTVEPGFGGQSYMPECAEKVRELRTRLGGRRLHVQVDGGLTHVTAQHAGEQGVSSIVAGSYVFKAADRASAIQRLREAAGWTQ